MSGIGPQVDRIAQGYASGPLGIPIHRPAVADPQNVWTTRFTITGGLILLTMLGGVRTVIQAGGAGNLQFRHSVGPTNLCAAAAITGNAVGTIYAITGDTTDPVQIGAAGVAVMLGRVVATSTTYGGVPGILLGAGNIQLTCTAAAGTGSTRWFLRYFPIDYGAVVVAV